MRFLALLLLLCTLTGCSLAPDEYLSVTPHAGSVPQTTATDAVPVESYAELKAAILGFVEAGQAEGAIRVTNYNGSVEEDLTEAAYEVAKLEPLGAYAVDYMTHDCTWIVNYYEIRIRITFRRTAREIGSIEPVTTQVLLLRRLEQAVDQLESRLILRVSGYRDPDIVGMVESYCLANPDTVMETPTVSFTAYPDSGSVRIVEVDLDYTKKPEQLRAMELEVRDSINSAAEYIRYRQTDRDKTELLFTYLTERFPYTAGTTVTPLYDALCAGVADPGGLATAWQLICDQAGVDCFTVEGLYNGQLHRWNIVSHDGLYRHVDLARNILTGGSLQLLTDEDMAEYYWNPEGLPLCEPVQEIAPPVEEAPPANTEPPAEEEPPVAETPPAEEEPSIEEEPPAAEEPPTEEAPSEEHESDENLVEEESP